MLTPTAHDPNRKAELDRRKQNPADFGGDKVGLPRDWNPNGGLKPVGGESKPEGAKKSAGK